MKTEMLYDRLSDKWVPAPIDSLLVDKPLSVQDNSLLSSFDNKMLETADGYILEVAVPGMKRKDLTLEIADGVLTVEGRKQKRDVFGWARKTIEFRGTQIHKTFALPKDADADHIQAKCSDGLLRINIPKIRSRKTHRNIFIESVNENWWQKLAKPFRRLKTKVNCVLAKFGF